MKKVNKLLASDMPLPVAKRPKLIKVEKPRSYEQKAFPSGRTHGLEMPNWPGEIHNEQIRVMGGNVPRRNMEHAIRKKLVLTISADNIEAHLDRLMKTDGYVIDNGTFVFANGGWRMRRGARDYYFRAVRHTNGNVWFVFAGCRFYTFEEYYRRSLNWRTQTFKSEEWAHETERILDKLVDVCVAYDMSVGKF